MEEIIIIDGVDVAGCVFYLHKDGSCMSQDCECTLCKYNYCYYKQLKRLEEKYNKMVKISEENLIKYEVLRLKNLALEKELQNYKFSQSLEMPYDIKINELEKENEKLKTALEEIKKLTVIGINASQCNCGLRALADDILQIITEAIGE